MTEVMLQHWARDARVNPETLTKQVHELTCQVIALMAEVNKLQKFVGMDTAREVK